jgi:hypothetical protein
MSCCSACSPRVDASSDHPAQYSSSRCCCSSAASALLAEPCEGPEKGDAWSMGLRGAALGVCVRSRGGCRLN